MSEQFKITEPGFYRTRYNKRVEVLCKNPYDEKCPWLVASQSVVAYWVNDDGRGLDVAPHHDIVSRWEDPVEKFERVEIWETDNNRRMYTRCTIGGNEIVESCLYAVDEPGFAGYIYEHEGHTAISSLPSGWPVLNEGCTGALGISAEPWDDDDHPILPVAWRRLRVETKKEDVE